MKRITAMILVLVLMFSMIGCGKQAAESWTCPTCGKTAEAAFCSNCGAKRPETETQNGWVCPSCKKEASGAFCSNCGAKRPENEQTTEQETKEAEGTTSAETTTMPVVTEATTQTATTAGKKGFDRSATVEEFVIYEENGVRITVTSLEFDNYYMVLNLLLENDSESTVKLISGSSGYSRNSVNHMMTDIGYMNVELESGKKAKKAMNCSIEELKLLGITEVGELELAVQITIGDNDKIYTGPMQIRTSLYGTVETTDGALLSSFTNAENQKSLGYTVEAAKEENLEIHESVRLVSSVYMKNSYGSYSLVMELANDSSYAAEIGARDISVNSIVVRSGLWDSVVINPGKHALLTVQMDYLLDEQYLAALGMEKVSSIGLTIAALDGYWNTIIGRDYTLVIAEETGSLTEGMPVLYDANGVRILYAGTTKDSYTYSDDIHILMIAENTTGRELVISDDYNTLSVNGYMSSSYSMYSTTVPGNTKCLMELELWDSGFNQIDIKGIEDLETVEITIEIRDGNWHTIDTKAIGITY